jgi:protease IV
MTDQTDPSRRVEPKLTSQAAADAHENGAAEPVPGVAAASARAREPGWERAVLEKLVLATVTEQRRARRWSIFFRAFGLALLLLLVAASFGLLTPGDGAGARHTALVEIDGVIDADGEASAERVNAALRAAFKDRASAGIVLRINSPGGSPVQAGMISDEIRRLRAQHPDKPIYAVVEDICASGGYYVAAATDEIFVDKASLVGSIGVLINGFGFTGAMDKLGVERRLIAAGDNKGFLDPFSPMSDQQREHAARMLQVVHQQFVDTVRTGRKGKIKETPDMYTGLVWTGATAIELGLADRFGSVDVVARDVLKAEEVVDYTRRRTLAERLARSAGMGAGEALVRMIGIAPGGIGLR